MAIKPAEQGIVEYLEEAHRLEHCSIVAWTDAPLMCNHGAEVSGGIVYPATPVPPTLGPSPAAAQSSQQAALFKSEELEQLGGHDLHRQP